MAERVLVDVVVTDKKGQPVLDLTAEDFQVFEDGVRRQTLSFAAFGAAATRARQAGAPAGAAPFVLAATVLLIDDGHLSPPEAARLGPVLTEVLRGLYERRGSLMVLAPLSGVSVVGRLPEDAGALAQAASQIRGHRFPQISSFAMTDVEALDIELGDTEALKRLENRFRLLNLGLSDRVPGTVEGLVRVRAKEVASEVRNRRGDTFGALRAAFAWLAAQPGRHSVLLLSSGFPHDPVDPGFARIVTDSFEALAPIHFLDARAGMTADVFQGIEHTQALGQDSRVRSFEGPDAAAGSERLAEESGGLRAGGDLTRGLKRILDATRTYYVVGYEPLPRKKAGFRKIKVQVNRRGVEVLARRGYFDAGPRDVPKPEQK